ncbi:efflux transporter outer membrane subunit [Stutzerimonas tarimensis]|uniref:Efflux transporter outer membrane subunit n=1 Tax=Stutzerimonas tarimensis TaxID=1507735 RepID=A0ABV7T5Z0_9GAMM
MKASVMALSLLAVALGGCSMIPEYQRPTLPVELPTEQAAATTEAVPGWRDFFQDPALHRLVEIALAENRDLRVAALNLQAYQALYRIQRADRWPLISADAAGSRSRTPGSLSPSGEATVGNQYSATLGVSWELDLFGRIASLREQALEQYFASEAAQRSTQVALVASVANAWLTWQADQTLLRLTRETLDAYEHSLRLTQRSFDVGVASALDLSQARSAVDSARVAFERYSRQVALDRNALVLLLGRGIPEDIEPGWDQERLQLADLPVGLSSTLLTQRPDILQAEHALKAANANIGAARAAFFPRIGLTGAAGTASNELSGLFDGGSGYWSFLPSISVPIFTAGQLRASVDYAELSRDAQIARYEQAIQVAFREVSDGLAARVTYARQVQAQRALVETSQDYYRLAERRYRTGVDSYLLLLDAQRQLFDAQQQLILDQLAQLSSEVELFKALGGGWYAEADPAL